MKLCKKKEKIKFFTYLSKNKIDMLYSQLHTERRGTLHLELKANYLFIAGKASQDTEIISNYYKKMRVVLKKLTDIGSIWDEDISYIKGTMNMSNGELLNDSSAIFWVGSESKDGIHNIVFLIGTAGNCLANNLDKVVTSRSGLSVFFCKRGDELDFDAAIPYSNEIDEQAIRRIKYIINELRGKCLNVQEKLEFTAKTLKIIKDEESDGTITNYIIATPIYVAQK